VQELTEDTTPAPVPTGPARVERALGRVDALAARAITPAAGLAAMVLLYVAYFGDLTWRQQSNFGTFGFDMGIFDQEIWEASRFGSTFLTTRGLSMWANHVNPIIYLLVPFYWLGAGPHFLYLAQTVVLAAGAIPLWLLARDRFGDSWLALGVPAAWRLYPALEWNNWWHFHPEALAVTPLLFAWWFAGKGRWRWYAVCVVLVLACKEDAAFTVIALGAAVAIRYRRRVGLVTMGAAFAWLVVCLKLIIPHATGSSNPFYAYQYSELGRTTNQIVFNFFRHPSRVLRIAVRRRYREYYWKLFAPVAGLSLLAPTVLLIVVPALILNVANTQGYAIEIRYQYQLLIMAGIFLAVVEGIGKQRSAPVRRFCVGLLCACALATNAAWSPSLLDTPLYHAGTWAKPNARTVILEEAVHLVPGRAGVSASYDLTSHLTHRYHIYDWPNPFQMSYWGLDRNPDPPSNVDYLVLDTGVNTGTAALLNTLIGPGGQFSVVFEDNGILVAHRVRPASTGGGGGAPAGGGAPRPQSRCLSISDHDVSKIVYEAFPLRPCGPPPPYDGGSL
jgi:uncharacterized membrane protein